MEHVLGVAMAHFLEPENVLRVAKQDSKGSCFTQILGACFAQQFSLKKGLEQFGKDGEQAVTKELQQLHDMVTYHPQYPKKSQRLTLDKRR